MSAMYEHYAQAIDGQMQVVVGKSYKKLWKKPENDFKADSDSRQQVSSSTLQPLMSKA